MDVVVVFCKVKGKQMLVGDEQDSVLLKAIAIVLGDVTRVKELFVIIQRLPHIQGLSVNTERVIPRKVFHSLIIFPISLSIISD